jgi:hypothetical protein
VQSVVSARYALLRLVNPAGRREVKAENKAIQELGENLRARLEGELGPEYRVTYQH